MENGGQKVIRRILLLTESNKTNITFIRISKNQNLSKYPEN